MYKIIRKTLGAAAALAVSAVLIAGTAQARNYCEGTGTPLPKEKVMAMLAAQGYTGVRDLETEHGCYEAKGKDKNGTRVEVYIEPATGKIVKIK